MSLFCRIFFNKTNSSIKKADVISKSDYITLKTNTPTRVPNTTLQQTSSPDITTVSNTLYNRTSWTTQHEPSLYHLPIIATINIRHDYRLQQNRRTFTNYKKADWTQLRKTQSPLSQQTTIPTNIHTANIIFTNIILIADKHNIPKGNMHSKQQLHAITRPHSMQNRTEKQHKDFKYLRSSSQALK